MKNIVVKCFNNIPAILKTEYGRKIEFVKSDKDPTISAELLCEEIVKESIIKITSRNWKAESAIKKVIGDAELYSEEREKLISKKNAKFTFLLDPIDGTFFALRGLSGGCIGISFHDRKTMNPIASIVGDFQTKDIYWADGTGAYLNDKKIFVSSITNIEDAFISTCYGKQSRFKKLLSNKKVIKNAAWFETTGTMVSLVKVATGQIDAYYDFMLGYKSYDFAPSAFIAQMAGAVVIDVRGKPLKYSRILNRRQKFIIASTPELARSIFNLLKVD